MSIAELLLIAVALSMDAFAVSICTGVTMETVKLRKALVVGAYFGGFQAAMPLIGYFLGTRFSHLIERYDHWIAFGLLALIGGKMIVESLEKETDAEDSARCKEASLGPKRMLPLAVATSIDALAVGVSFAVLSVEIAPAVALIGVITLFLSMAGVKLGHEFGARFKSKAELAGGVVLVLIGLKILLEHMGLL